jgi:hypothetical protein
MEYWKPVVGYEGVYEISNLGRARRLIAGRRTQAGRILKPVADGRGYRTYSFSKGGVVCRKLAHHAVTDAFLGPRGEGLQVNHKNGVKHDNSLENLEYVTSGENTRHAKYVLGRNNEGVRHGFARFTEADIISMRDMRQSGMTCAAIGKHFGCVYRTVWDITSGRRWRHI